MRTYYEKVLIAIENPTWILRDYSGALVAVLSLGKQRFLNVVYREISRRDGFVITAFVSNKVNRANRIWPKEKS
jgi:hypothetical protein